MRRIERTTAFGRDHRRVQATPEHRDIEELLPLILTLLATGTPLPPKYGDHQGQAFVGDLDGFDGDGVAEKPQRLDNSITS